MLDSNCNCRISFGHKICLEKISAGSDVLDGAAVKSNSGTGLYYTANTNVPWAGGDKCTFRR